MHHTEEVVPPARVEIEVHQDWGHSRWCVTAYCWVGYDIVASVSDLLDTDYWSATDVEAHTEALRARLLAPWALATPPTGCGS